MSNFEDLVKQLQLLETENINPDTTNIDKLSSVEICDKINNADQTIADVVKQAITPISNTAETFAVTLKSGGRIFYVGAGTSGRLGVLDAAECPPTFGTNPNQIIGIIAGGHKALVESIEGAEDSIDSAINDLKRYTLLKSDFVIGICASRRTPYTLSALKYADSLGCKTAFVICNKADKLPISPTFLIELPVGPEVITGSTRMKSGTAQKLALNMISTTAMVLIGKTYGNLMIDLESRSKKLAARSRKILIDLLKIDLQQAEDLLSKANGSVKLAIVMQTYSCDSRKAKELLKEADGFISKIK